MAGVLGREFAAVGHAIRLGLRPAAGERRLPDQVRDAIRAARGTGAAVPFPFDPRGAGRRDIQVRGCSALRSAGLDASAGLGKRTPGGALGISIYRRAYPVIGQDVGVVPATVGLAGIAIRVPDHRAVALAGDRTTSLGGFLDRRRLGGGIRPARLLHAIRTTVLLLGIAIAAIVFRFRTRAAAAPVLVVDGIVVLAVVFIGMDRLAFGVGLALETDGGVLNPEAGDAASHVLDRIGDRVGSDNDIVGGNRHGEGSQRTESSTGQADVMAVHRC